MIDRTDLRQQLDQLGALIMNTRHCLADYDATEVADHMGDVAETLSQMSVVLKDLSTKAEFLRDLAYRREEEEKTHGEDA